MDSRLLDFLERADADEASLHEFARIAGIVFGATRFGKPMSTGIGDLRVPDDDEDAA